MRLHEFLRATKAEDATISDARPGMIIRDCDTIYQKLFGNEGMPIKVRNELKVRTLSFWRIFRRAATPSTRWFTA